MDDVLRWSRLSEAINREGRVATSDAVRAVLDHLRKEIADGALDDAGAQLAIEGIADAVERELRSSLGYSLQRVINASGVVLHTNLGRAPISPAAVKHLSEIAGGYSNLEFDLANGERGRRDAHAQRLLDRLLSSHSYSQPRSPDSSPEA
ncbi:MAG TPA: hypothetical protein VFE08_11135, partial [Candidatus Sulfotelmatobacter sp.]|nr:hypothetical protein [Candidatus Sulfotelmatobacter sp.]